MSAEASLVSVVIPCYNADAWIRETLESVLSQCYPRIQLVVVDDGSVDETRATVARYREQLELISAEHAGASRARNRGTTAAHGRYIQYLDSDDLLAPDAISARVRALETTGADVAYSGWQRFRDSEAGRQRLELNDRDLAEWGDDAELAILSGFWAPPAAILYRREIVDAIGQWNERLPVIQDARFIFDAAHRGARFVRVSGVGALHRVLPGSLSRRDDLAFVRDVFVNAVEIQSLWIQSGALTAARRVGLAGLYDYVARTLLSREPRMFRDALRRRRELEPWSRITYTDVAGALSRLIGQAAARRLLKLAGRGQ